MDAVIQQLRIAAAGVMCGASFLVILLAVAGAF
jgi:hypothetical protein